jgi:ketosteroid isomerase-like protein
MQTEHAAGNAAGPTAPTPNDIVNGYFAALNSSDTENLTGLFAEGGVMMADDYPSAVGKSAIRAMFEGAFAATKIQMDCHIGSVVERDGLAVVRAPAVVSVAASGDRQLVVQRGIPVSPAGWREIKEVPHRAE